MKEVPPAPPGWNKILDDLLPDEQHTGDEFEWARRYQFSLLPSDTRFPLSGDEYEALEDIEVNYLTHWAAPFTGGGKSILKRGELVKVDVFSNQKQLAYYAKGISHKELEERMVPAQEREADKYGGFSLSIRIEDLNSKFKLIRTTEPQ